MSAASRSARCGDDIRAMSRTARTASIGSADSDAPTRSCMDAGTGRSSPGPGRCGIRSIDRVSSIASNGLPPDSCASRTTSGRLSDDVEALAQHVVQRADAEGHERHALDVRRSIPARAAVRSSSVPVVRRLTTTRTRPDVRRKAKRSARSLGRIEPRCVVDSDEHARVGPFACSVEQRCASRTRARARQLPDRHPRASSLPARRGAADRAASLDSSVSGASRSASATSGSGGLGLRRRAPQHEHSVGRRVLPVSASTSAVLPMPAGPSSSTRRCAVSARHRWSSTASRPTTVPDHGTSLPSRWDGVHAANGWWRRVPSRLLRPCAARSR